jgi:hypothetical protein
LSSYLEFRLSDSDIFFPSETASKSIAATAESHASEWLGRRVFGLQIEEKMGCLSGLSQLITYVAVANFGLRMRFQTTVC